MTTVVDTADRPPSARPPARAPPPPTGAWPTSLESVLSDNTRRTYDDPVAACSTTGATRSGSPLSPPSPSPWPGTWPPGPAPAPSVATHPAGRLGHIEGPRMGEAGIALPGPGRARLFKGMGPAPFETPAPVRRPHRRRPGRDPAHRRPTQEDAAAASRRRSRLRNGGQFDVALVAALSDAGLQAFSEASSLTWGDVQTLGGRLRPHHRGPFEDRRRGPGRHRGHHPRRHGGALRHPAGGRW